LVYGFRFVVAFCYLLSKLRVDVISPPAIRSKSNIAIGQLLKVKNGCVHFRVKDNGEIFPFLQFPVTACFEYTNVKRCARYAVSMVSVGFDCYHVNLPFKKVYDPYNNRNYNSLASQKDETKDNGFCPSLE
jgi:hypothetical protein